ncbi:hypothetical protein LSH36_95g07053, partial [Paralvinella palmiformis]
MSAEAVLTGLYPPSNKQMWKTDLKWQPIPVHNMPQQLEKEKLVTLSNYTGYNYSSIFDEDLRLTFDALQSE